MTIQVGVVDATFGHAVYGGDLADLRFSAGAALGEIRCSLLTEVTSTRLAFDVDWAGDLPPIESQVTLVPGATNAIVVAPDQTISVVPIARSGHGPTQRALVDLDPASDGMALVSAGGAAIASATRSGEPLAWFDTDAADVLVDLGDDGSPDLATGDFAGIPPAVLLALRGRDGGLFSSASATSATPGRDHADEPSTAPTSTCWAPSTAPSCR
ncbi:MAG: hypothetical protein U1F43_35880 [Myxococcota bacterium]